MDTPKKKAGKRSQRISDDRKKKKPSTKSTVKNPLLPPNEITVLNPTPVNSQENTQLVPATDNPKEISIWELKKFPSNTKPVKVTPKKLKNALDEYGHCKSTLQDVLKKYKIRHQSFFDLIGHYDEIRDYYSRMRHRKSEYYGKASLELWEELPDDKVFYQYDREGNKSLTTAAVQYLKVKNEAMLRHAQICETGSFVPISKQEVNKRTLSIGVNINKTVPEGFDMANSSPDQLLDVLKDRKRIDR